MKNNLEHAFTEFKLVRQKNRELIQAIPNDLLQVIPKGFSNNIYWNAGHLLTVQESLIYRRSGLPMHIDDSYLTYFAKGSSPADFDDKIPTIDSLLRQYETTTRTLEEDLPKYADKSYPEAVQVSFGLTLRSFSDAVCALPYHEAYHLGVMNLLKKFLN